VTEISLERPRVMALVGQSIAAGVPEHVRMGLERELGGNAGALDHAGKAGGAEWRAPLRREDERRLRLLKQLGRPR